jgi:hypothetical protein
MDEYRASLMVHIFIPRAAVRYPDEVLQEITRMRLPWMLLNWVGERVPTNKIVADAQKTREWLYEQYAAHVATYGDALQNDDALPENYALRTSTELLENTNLLTSGGVDPSPKLVAEGDPVEHSVVLKGATGDLSQVNLKLVPTELNEETKPTLKEALEKAKKAAGDFQKTWGDDDEGDS